MNAPQHPVSVLRRQIRKTQKEMGELVGCSAKTIQAVEYGKLELSEILAQKISAQTGVDLEFLLGGDAGRPPIDVEGRPYTSEIFDQTQSELKHPAQEAVTTKHADAVLASYVQQICAILAQAVYDRKFNLCVYKFDQAIERLANEFGSGALPGNPIPARKTDAMESSNAEAWDIIEPVVRAYSAKIARVIRTQRAKGNAP
jgi:DNA-binding XRE family transcriptional regulator